MCSLDSYLFWVLGNECVYGTSVHIYILNIIYRNAAIGYLSFKYM